MVMTIMMVKLIQCLVVILIVILIFLLINYGVMLEQKIALFLMILNYHLMEL